MSTEVAEARAAIVRASELLFSSGVMQHSGHANMSVRIGTEQMVLTSTGSIRKLTEDSLALVSFDGEVQEGRIEPTTAEIVAMHAGVYRERRDVSAIIHTHSPHVTAFALAHQPLPCAYEALLRFGVAQDIAVAQWAPRGSEASVANIIGCMRDNPGVPAVLLANHGLLAFGKDPITTARLIMAMEEAAEMTLFARQLGGEQLFPEDALERERARMQQFESGR